jgi:sulfite exporter TauE/SafE
MHYNSGRVLAYLPFGAILDMFCPLNNLMHAIHRPEFIIKTGEYFFPD